MAHSIIIYTQLPLKDLKAVLEAHREEFDELLEENFSEEELVTFEKYLDAMAIVEAQPLLSELTFEDLDSDPAALKDQHDFFTHVRSSLLIEHLPYLEGNPFQVSYLTALLKKLPEVLVDPGQGPLTFKEGQLQLLGKLKSMDQLMGLIQSVEVPVMKKGSLPVDPIDFLVRDVYREWHRLRDQGKLTEVLQRLNGESEKLKDLFFAVREETLDATALYRKAKLGAKEFDDLLERLKFFLKKI